MDAIHDLARKKTIILIAHRLNSVRECDCIYLLEQGRISASGRYESLVEDNVVFRSMAGHGN